MTEQYLPEFAGAYLEDSYFLGVVAEGADLCLRFLFALTIDHDAYAPPLPGEAHCYREGFIRCSGATVLKWRWDAAPRIMKDLDGTFDFGSIQLYRVSETSHRFITEWFDATIEAGWFDLVLDDRDSRRSEL